MKAGVLDRRMRLFLYAVILGFGVFWLIYRLTAAALKMMP